MAAFSRFTGVDLILALIIIGLIFNCYLIKRRNSRRLTANQRELDRKDTFSEKLLEEKEWLIKELHHRVRSNLQIVTSLLHSQSIYIKDVAALQAIKDSIRRMQAMSLVYQKLYQEESISTISMREYINDLVQYLHGSFDDGSQIIFEEAVEPIDLDVSQAISLGLIVAEGVVNAIKHAFVNRQSGIVTINLERTGDGYLLLQISDNGIGLPAAFNIRECYSLGFNLMQGLARQLDGSLGIENKNGVHIAVRFRREFI